MHEYQILHQKWLILLFFVLYFWFKLISEIQEKL
jgi:hypothetical protein